MASSPSEPVVTAPVPADVRQCAESLLSLAHDIAEAGPWDEGTNAGAAALLSLHARRWLREPLDPESIRRGQELWNGAR